MRGAWPVPSILDEVSPLSSPFFPFLCVPLRPQAKRAVNVRLKAADGDVFGLQVGFQALDAAFAADAAFLHAAERGLGGGGNSIVDADDAVFQPFRHADRGTEILRH